MDTQKVCVLHIDDEPTNVLLFEINFQNKYKVISAYNGHEGLEKVKENPEIRVVFCDMKMPEISGIEFAKQLQAIKPGTPCFILTGYDLSPDLINEINNGTVSGYIQKPFEVEHIDNAVKKTLENS
jgi:response regulator RpfG family c-di-GMP phosphodiesterase